MVDEGRDAIDEMMSWVPTLIDSAEAWMQRHETTSDLTTVWTLCISLIIVGVVDIVLWWFMRHTRDRSDAGYPLKRKKLSAGLAEIGFGFLFALTLWGYYHEHQFGPFARYTIRFLVSAAYVGAAIWGIRFLFAYLRERRKHIMHDTPDIIAVDRRS